MAVTTTNDYDNITDDNTRFSAIPGHPNRAANTWANPLDVDSASKVPVVSLYTIMVIYMFLPIASKDLAVCLGFAVSIVSITASSTCNVIQCNLDPKNLYALINIVYSMYWTWLHHMQSTPK